jgi:transposase
VTAKQREEPDTLLRRPSVAAGLAKRARAILLLADGATVSTTSRLVPMQRRHLYKWIDCFRRLGLAGLLDGIRTGRPPVFSPEVAIHLVKISCERPDDVGRSLSHWDCAELARQLITDQVVDAISPQTVQRILANHKLKPWRKHLWLSPKVPRDAEFCKRVKNIRTLYTRKLAPHEMGLCVDEKTSLQPRTRLSPTLAAKPGLPVRVEHEYQRQGAWNLFAAFDTRPGKVYAHTAERKRQKEFIEFLEQVDREIPASVTKVHLVMDNLRMHTGKQVQAWLEKHPRFKVHHPPVHCSWMNQVEQWFSIVQRQRLAISDFADKGQLAERLHVFVKEWNEHAHPFNRTRKSVTKIMAKCELAKCETPTAMAA